MCTTMTGFRPIAVAAAASLPGRIVSAVLAASRHATPTEAAAMTLNARSVPATEPPQTLTTAAESSVNAGPYTDGASIHSREATRTNGSDGKADGGTTYGFAPCSVKILPYTA